MIILSHTHSLGFAVLGEISSCSIRFSQVFPLLSLLLIPPLVAAKPAETFSLKPESVRVRPVLVTLQPITHFRRAYKTTSRALRQRAGAGAHTTSTPALELEHLRCLNRDKILSSLWQQRAPIKSRMKLRHKARRRRDLLSTGLPRAMSMCSRPTTWVL